MRDRGKNSVRHGRFRDSRHVSLLEPLGCRGAVPGRAELEYPSEAEACVEDTPFMRANHMDLLNHWRDDLVRSGITEYTSASGDDLPHQSHQDLSGLP